MSSDLPDHLQGETPQGLIPGEIVAQYEVGDYQNFNYLLVDWSSKSALLVDPQIEISPIFSDLDRHDLTLNGVLLTHTHFDHIPGIPVIHQRWPSVPIYVHALDRHRLRTTHHLQEIHDGDCLSLGEIQIHVLHTPGHSAGECSYYFAPYLLTGDTVFVRRIGRVDFPTGDVHQMWESLQRIKSLPKDTVFLVGHHYEPPIATTLAQELEQNPAFQATSVEELSIFLKQRLEIILGRKN